MVKNELLTLIDEAFERPRSFGIYQGVRKFKHGQLFKNVWFVNSIKNDANIACESDLEKKLCLHMEFENNVMSYRPQPFKIKLQGFSYTPDFIVKLDSGLYTIREAKRRHEANSDFYQHRFTVIREFCQSHGVMFEVFTDEDLESSTLKRHEFLYHCMRGSKPSMKLIQNCYRALLHAEFKITTISHAQKLVESLGFNANLIVHLIARGFLESNICEQLGNDSYVALKGVMK